MAVLGRLLVSSAERLDLADLLSIDSYTAGDFKYLLKGLVGDTRPYILKGFDVLDPVNSIGTQSCSIKVADSVVFYPGSSAGPFFHGLAEGHSLAQPLVPELRKNAVNYVYLTLSTFNTSVDTRAFWDPDKDGGAGGEFTQDVNTESALKVEVNVSVGSFPANTIPIAKITVGPVVITKIEDSRDMMFRLGTGGLNPDPFSRYTWKSYPSAGYERAEPPTAITAGGVNPFKGADKNINSLKEWMDAVMSKIAELGGTAYWYEDASTYSLTSVFVDSLASAFKSKGSWVHDPSIPGQVTWTEDINLKITADPRTIIIRDGTEVLNDEQVLYVPLVRKQPLNSTDQDVQWENGVNYVNAIGGAVGLFANLNQGDWVKKINDPNHYFLRVEQFYDALDLGGSPTTPANAKSIRLSGTYQGTDEQERGRYDKGVYLSGDAVVSDRDNVALTAAGGNFHWLALRSDIDENISDITETILSVDITEADGSTAKCTSSTNHGLLDGDRVTIVSGGYAGVYKVEVESVDVFYISTSSTGDELGVTAQYSVVTTAARSTPYGLQLESATHGFKTDETITISSTLGYDGQHAVSVRNSTSFNIATANGNESSGSATLARVIVRSEQGVLTLVQGTSGEIGGSEAQAIRTFLGMSSPVQTNPFYAVSPSYNALDGMANFNSSVTDTVTERLSKLTAMMADKAQDKNIKYIVRNTNTITNTTSGANQVLTFSHTSGLVPELVFPLPGSGVKTTVALPSSAPGIILPVNSVASVSIDRNSNSVSAITVTSILDCVVDENKFILAIRLGDSEIYLWDGIAVHADDSDPTINHLFDIVRQDRNLKLVAGGMWTWTTVGNTLSWNSSAYVQIPGLFNTRNTIAAGSVVLPSDGYVAYIDINRTSGIAANLAVNTSTLSSMIPTTDRLIIARRVGNSILLGSNDSILLAAGDSKALDSDDSVGRVRVADLTNASLPSTASVTIDGISLINGDKVLFTNAALNGIYIVDGIGTAATWIKTNSFAGSVFPHEGALVAVQDGIAAFNTLWSYFNGSWKQVEHSELVKEPTGFPNRTDSTLSFNDLTRTFTIQPASVEFDVYQKGKAYRFNSAQTYTIPNVQGLHYIYFNNGLLSSTQVFTTDIIKEYAFVATVYWDLANTKQILFGDERHGLVMDGETHSYLHQSVGARYISGLSADNYTTAGTGAADSDATLSISDGVIRDEDIQFNITDAAVPSNPFEQILDPIAKIPVYYRSGVSGDWKKETATDFPVKTGASRVQYNDPSGPWTLVDATADDNYVAMWIFATNNISEPIIAIMGQREDSTLNDAQANNVYEGVSFGSLPSAEMKVIYRLIFKTNSTYANTPKAALADVRDLRRAIDTALGPYAPSDHGLLTGLTDQDHPDYAIFVANPAAYVGALKQISVTDNDDVQKALDSIDRFFAQLRIYPHPSDGKRVKISGASQALTNSITLSQSIKNLLISFDGAEIDFSTGQVYASDGITPLGINFTPAVITAGQYHWYSISAKSSTTNSNNTVNLLLSIRSATGDGVTQDAAPRAKFKSGIQIGQVCVQQSGLSIANITASNIVQMNAGGGGGGSLEISNEQNLLNNQSNVNLDDMLLDYTENKAAKVEYSIVRIQGAVDLVEQGSLSLIYKTSTATWSISGHTYAGDSTQVTFNVTGAGQVQYTSSNIVGAITEFIIKWTMKPL